MLTICIHHQASKLADYHLEHIEKGVLSDYYTEYECPSVRWTGAAAHRFGLEDELVTSEHFERLIKNQHPFTSKQLTPRKKVNARSAFDFVYSIPKSLSILALVIGDERILNAHRDAVHKVLRYMELFVRARVRKGGANEDRTTGNFIAVCFEHLISRENDPQVHTHAVIPNITRDETEGTWKAIQAIELFRRRGLFTEVYRSALAQGLHSIGYQTRATKAGFEIAGVPKAVIDTFSKRKIQIDSIAAARGDLNNPALRAGIARKFRKAKDSSLSIADLRALWEAQLSPEDLARLHSLKASANSPLDLPKPNLPATIDWAARHHFERRSAVRMIDLTTSVLAAERGAFQVDQIEAAITSARDKFITVGDYVTTNDALAIEQELIATVNAGVGKLSPINESFRFSADLSREQCEVAASLLLCPDRFSILTGPPGARKTSTLRPIVSAAKEAHFHVILLAPSSSATETLRKDGFFSALTMQRFLKDKDAQFAAAGELVILDEAGLTSAADMLALTKLAVTHDFRLMVSGDSRQHRSVEAGDALRLLEKYSRIHRAELKTISRQVHPLYLEAVTAFREGNFASGIEILSDLHWVKEVDVDDGYTLLAADYSAAVSLKQSALAVAATWREIALVTEAIRMTERAAGRLTGEDLMVPTLTPLHLTKAERERAPYIPEGSVLIFARKSKLFNRNEHAIVVGHLNGFLSIRRSNGEALVIDPVNHAKGFQVFQPQDIPVATGDSLLLRANGQTTSGSRLINGQIVRVKSVKNGVIQLEDGRSLPPGYQHFAHGYCITSQAAQGKTVDHVFLALDAESASSAATRETLYVGTSRARHSCTIYTDGRPELEAAFSRSSERIAAMELTSQTPPTMSKSSYQKIGRPTRIHTPNDPVPPWAFK